MKNEIIAYSVERRAFLSVISVCPAGRRYPLSAKDGFTLIELLVVLIIIGILAGLAIPSYIRIRERAFDREAQVDLRLIQMAEKAYLSKFGTYLVCIDTTAINANLQLDLASQSWNLSVSLPSSTTFSGVAVRTDAGNTRNWTITQDTTIVPTCGGSTCP